MVQQKRDQINMKEYNSNYLGIVINNNDPEYRGRVQVFVPHIMPALYEGWNKDGNDINISCVGDNIENSLNSEIVDRLQKILPWAEAASPIIGSSAPGGVLQAVGSAIESAAGAIVEGAKKLFVQTPTSNPVSSSSGNNLADSALSLVGTSTGNIPGYNTDGGNLGCAAAVSLMFKKATGQDIIPGQPIVTGTSTLYSHMSKSSDYVQVPIDQMEPGDILVTARGSRAGHTGIYVGDGRIVSNSSSGFQGSARGTIQNNYNVNSWKKGVVSRNPEQSAVFRHVGQTSQAASQIESSKLSEQAGTTGLPSAPNPLATTSGPQGSEVQTSITPNTSLEPLQAASGAGTVSNTIQGSSSGPHKGKTIVSATGINGSGTTTVTYSDGTTSTLNQPRPIRNNNPGNLEYGSFAKKMGAVGSDGRYAVFPTVEAGATAKVALLKTSTYQNLSIKDAFNRYAPPSENPNYIRDLQSGTGFDLNRKMNSLSDKEFTLLTNTVSKIEGFNAPLPQGTELPSSFSAATSVVNKTDGYGKTIVKNTNDMAKGLFAFPNVGAMVWVFFREGNPLYPVYFAASYSSSEWQSAYRGSSLNASGTNTGNPSKDEIANSTNLNFNSAGGIESTEVINVADPSKNKKVLMIHGPDGSNRVFTPGYVQDYSRGSKRDQVDSNSFRIVGGYEEKWVEADSSYNVRGNNIIKIGKFDQEAVDAMQALSNFSNEINQSLKTT